MGSDLRVNRWGGGVGPPRTQGVWDLRVDRGVAPPRRETSAYSDERLQRRALTSTSAYSDEPYSDERLQRRALTATSAYSDERLQRRALTATSAYSDERLQRPALTETGVSDLRVDSGVGPPRKQVGGGGSDLRVHRGVGPPGRQAGLDLRVERRELTATSAYSD